MPANSQVGARLAGPAITLALAIAGETLAQTLYRIPNPPAILVVVIVFSAFYGGLASGLASAAIAWAYLLLHFSDPGAYFHYSADNLSRIVLWGISMPLTALLVGVLKRRVEKAASTAGEHAVVEARLNERSRAELAIRARELRIEGIIASMAEGIVSIDETLRIVLFNPAAEQMFGRSSEQMTGQPLSALIPERFRAQHDEHIRKFAATGQTNRAMGRYGLIYGLRAGGEEFPIEATISQAGISPNKLFTVILRDITERRLAEEALREGEERLRFALDGMGVGEWALDLVDHTAHRSLQHDRIFGYETLQPQWTYELFLEHVLPEDRDLVDRKFRQAVAVGHDWNFECRIVRCDQQVRWIWASGRHHLDESGNPKRLVGIVQDITERRLAEEAIRRLNAELEQRVEQRTAELASANRDLEAFSYSTSHDLRAPLRAISGFAQILAHRHRGSLNEEGRHYFDNIVEASTHMGRLLDDLLNYARLGRRAVSMQPMALSEVLTQIEKNLAARISETGAELVIPRELPAIESDPTLLGQALTNLIDNALRYHRPAVPPRVEFACELSAGRVTLTVADNGIGIPAEHFDRIFNTFQRLHSQEEYPGTGIGLAIVKRAVEMLGGRVWVESAVGAGSRFFVELPLHAVNDTRRQP